MEILPGAQEIALRRKIGRLDHQTRIQILNEMAS
jgi:hypothetical protein